MHSIKKLNFHDIQIWFLETKKSQKHNPIQKPNNEMGNWNEEYLRRRWKDGAKNSRRRRVLGTEQLICKWIRRRRSSWLSSFHFSLSYCWISQPPRKREMNITKFKNHRQRKRKYKWEKKKEGKDTWRSRHREKRIHRTPIYKPFTRTISEI